MVSQIKTNKLDQILIHRVWGYVVLAFFIWFMFFATFKIGEYPMMWMEDGVSWVSNWLNNNVSEGILSDMLSFGVVQGVGGVLVFLPNILILFLFISLMEETGYMARVAYLMDKLMHGMGLHGKSFVPMIMGFGCNVPAIMATRTIENKKDRLLTMLIIPFMSCSARLPVYILIIGTFFPQHAVLILCLLYLLGILLAVLFAFVFKKTILKTLSAEYKMILPRYRIPTIKTTLGILWFNTKDYLKKMGGIILISSIVIWFLMNYPTVDSPDTSFLAYFGRFIEPILAPLGFDWKIGISLLSGFGAKEVIVSTISVVQPVFTHASALSFLVFVLIYFPCMGVFAAVGRESGKWKWAFFLAFYTTTLAWILSFITYRIAILF